MTCIHKMEKVHQTSLPLTSLLAG